MIVGRADVDVVKVLMESLTLSDSNFVWGRITYKMLVLVEVTSVRLRYEVAVVSGIMVETLVPVM